LKEGKKRKVIWQKERGEGRKKKRGWFHTGEEIRVNERGWEGSKPRFRYTIQENPWKGDRGEEIGEKAVPQESSNGIGVKIERYPLGK